MTETEFQLFCVLGAVLSLNVSLLGLLLARHLQSHRKGR